MTRASKVEKKAEKETHGRRQTCLPQDVGGWVIPSLWLLAFFCRLVSLQLNDGYLFQVTNPLKVWDSSLCHAENTHALQRVCVCVNSELSSHSGWNSSSPASWCLLKLTNKCMFLSQNLEYMFTKPLTTTVLYIQYFIHMWEEDSSVFYLHICA